MLLAKKWGILIKKESESLVFTGLEIPRDYYIVREGYRIPTAGKVNCAYIDGERVDDENILEALTDILSQRDDAGTLYNISDNKQEKDKWKHVVVGYEDCPVGTDYSIYGISKVDSKWVVVFRDEVGKLEDNKFPVIYHEVDEKYNEVFECSRIWMH